MIYFISILFNILLFVIILPIDFVTMQLHISIKILIILNLFINI